MSALRRLQPQPGSKYLIQSTCGASLSTKIIEGRIMVWMSDYGILDIVVNKEVSRTALFCSTKGFS